MATNIGPKIGVDGEKEYRDAMQSIIQQQKTLKAEMNETASAFDKNATAEDKAKAKMEGLSKQIELQKEAVERLQKMTDKASESTEVSANDTLKYKEALAKAQTELNNMESEMRDLQDVVDKAPSKWKQLSDKMDEVGEKMKNLGGKMKSFGEDFTKYVSAPITALAGLSVKAFKDVDNAEDGLRKRTGKTGEAFEELWGVAKDIATTLPFALDDTSDAVGEVSTRFDATGDDVSVLATQFLKFSNIMDTDVVSSIDGTQKTMAAWNLTSDKTGMVLDVLASVAQNTGADVNTLNTNLASNKVLFDDMGMSVFTAAGFLGNLDKSGIDANAVLAGLKKALQNATKEGKPLDEALQELTDTMTGSTTDTEAYAAAMELFGNKAGPQLADALRDGRVSFTEFERQAASSMGSVEQTFNDTLDPIDRYTVLMNDLKIGGAELGATLLETLAPAIEKVIDFVQKACEWWTNLDEDTQDMIIIIGGVIALLGPLITLLGSLAIAAGALNIALGPLTLIIIAVGAAIAGVIYLITHWEEAIENVKEKWEMIKATVKIATEAISGWVTKNVTEAADWMKDKWEDAKQWTSEAWENVKSTVKDAAEAVSSWVSEKWDNIKGKVSETWENLKSGTKEAWENIKSKVEENGGGIQGFLTTVEEEIKNGWASAFEWINEKTGGKLGEVWQTVTDKLAEIKQKFVDKWEEIKSTVSEAIEKIKGFFKFDWELPKIKLPHFSITGEFSLSPLRVPHLSVSWYKKAYDNAMVFSQPTVLATASGLKGFGDGNGAEMVIGQRTLLDSIETAMRNVGGSNTYDININVYGAEGQDVDEIATEVAEKLSFEISRREAALA